MLGPSKATGIAVHAGFPNAASDQSIGALDLHALLIANPLSTYFMSVQGAQWEADGIFDGDVLLVDKSIQPKANDIVVWVYDGELAVSYIHDVPEGAEAWGVVTSAIHRYRRVRQGRGDKTKDKRF